MHDDPFIALPLIEDRKMQVEYRQLEPPPEPAYVTMLSKLGLVRTTRRHRISHSTFSGLFYNTVALH